MEEWEERTRKDKRIGWKERGREHWRKKEGRKKKKGRRRKGSRGKKKNV